MNHVGTVFLMFAVALPAGATFFSDTGNIIDNSAGNSANGREYKAADAERQAAAGTAAAISAGSLFTAAGVRDLAALNFASAAKNFGMAGTEFAQAAATASDGAKNGAQRDMLLDSTGETGSQSGYDAASVAQSLLTPEARQALASQGINPDNFAGQLASGNIRTGTDALGALGQDTASYTPEQLDWLNDYSNVDMASVSGDAEAEQDGDRQLLGIDESAKSGDALAAAGGGGAGGAAGGPDGVPHELADRGLNARLPSIANGKVSPLKSVSSREPASMGMGFLEGLLGKKSPEEMELAKAELRQAGISQPRKGQNIFRLANRNYRSFNKWRATRVARH